MTNIQQDIACKRNDAWHVTSIRNDTTDITNIRGDTWL